jgi:hypothetical protein
VATVGWPATWPRLATHDRWRLDLGGHAARIGCGNELPAAREPPEPRSRSSSWPSNGRGDQIALGTQVGLAGQMSVLQGVQLLVRQLWRVRRPGEKDDGVPIELHDPHPNSR